MFEVHTTDTDRLRRIAAAGGIAIVLGLLMMLLNLVTPFFRARGTTPVTRCSDCLGRSWC